SAASSSAPPAWCASATAGIMARVNTGARGSHIGQVPHCAEAAIVLGETLGQDAPEYTVPTMFVRKVWVRRTGGRIGLVLGAASGGALGGMIVGAKSEFCPNPSANPFQSRPLNCHGNIPLGTAVGAAGGGALGWQLSRSNALLVRYVRQSQNRNSGADIGSKARGLLTANWEHAFGPSAQYHQQALIRVGVGALFRPLLATAPLVNASLELRYTVHPHVAFVGSLEDDVGRLPRQDFQFCATDASGNPVCQVYTSGAKVQHNFGFLVAIEWRP